MQTPIDFGKEFLIKLFDQRDADACMAMLAGDLVWITPENLHHFLTEGAVLRFLRKQIAAEKEPRYVDLVSIKSSPSADNIMTVAYEVNLVSREDERPLYLRCSMAICRRSKRLEITFLHFSKKSERDSTEQLRDFVTNLPCGVMILACLDGRREEAIYYNDYFAHRLRYRQEEFARAIQNNPFFMASEEDRERIRDEIAQARKNGGSIAANLRFYRRDGNSFYYRIKGAPAYQANGGTVYYCVFQETTGYQLNMDRLQSRLEAATEVIRQIPEGICGIEYAPGSRILQTLNGNKAGGDEPDGGASKGAEDADVRTFKKGQKGSRKRQEKEARVFFMSKNIPAMFGVSNSAYIRNILEDPFFGLEITSITRERLLSSHFFSPDKVSTGKALSCGIFRLLKPDGKSLRVELVVRSIKDQDGTMRLYLFYYDREEEQQDTEKRVERAVKMGRAAQEQLRSDLKKAREGADRRQSELMGELEAEREKHKKAVSRIEDQLVEEKNRCVLMSRQLEESKAVQKQMAAELEKSEADASKRIRNYQRSVDRRVTEANIAAAKAKQEADKRAQEAIRAAEEEVIRERRTAEERIQLIKSAAEEEIREARKNADKTVLEARSAAEEEIREARKNADKTVLEARSAAAKEAEEARQTADERSLLEEQLREAQERNRLLEAELKSERTRRLLLEEQMRRGSESLPELLKRDAGHLTDQTAGSSVEGAVLAGAAEAGLIAGSTVTASPSLTATAGVPAAAAAVSTGSAASGTSKSTAEIFTAGGILPGTAGVPAAAAPISVGYAASGTSKSAAGVFTDSAVLPETAGGMLRGTEASGRLQQKEQEDLRRKHGDWMITEKPLTVFSSMDLVRSNPGSEETFSSKDLVRGSSGPEETFSSMDLVRSSSGSDDKKSAALRGSLQGEPDSGEVSLTEGLLREKPFSPRECLRNVLIQEGRECGKKGISLRNIQNNVLPEKATGFGPILQQALCELIEQAIARTQAGGTISVYSRADRPSRGFVNLYFRIEDNGACISEEEMQTLFESEQTSGVKKLRFGMFSTRESAALMGGSINAQSGSRGSSFSLTVTVRV